MGLRVANAAPEKFASKIKANFTEPPARFA
jgi:hypothetical protein